MAEKAVLRFPVERAAALATGGHGASLRPEGTDTPAGGVARGPVAPAPHPAAPAGSSRVTAIEAAGALAGMALLQERPAEPQPPPSAGRDPGSAASPGAPEPGLPPPPRALDRPPAGAAPAPSPPQPTQDRSPQDRSAQDSGDQDQFDSRALALVRGFWTGSEPPGAAPQTGADALAPSDDQAQVETRALELARAFWPGSTPPVDMAARAGADTPSEGLQRGHGAETADASRDREGDGGDTAPDDAAAATATAPGFRRGLARRGWARRGWARRGWARRGWAIAAGVVLAVGLGVAMPFLPDRDRRVVAPEKPAEEAVTRLAPVPQEVPVVAAPAVPSPAVAPAVAPPAVPPVQAQAPEQAPVPAQVESPVEVRVEARPDPPPLILADLPPPEDPRPVILRPVSPAPASPTPASPTPSGQAQVSPAAANDAVTILRAANPSPTPPVPSSPPIASVPSTPSTPSIKALPPIVLASPPDDDRGAGAMILHPLPPPAASEPPPAGAPVLAQDSRPDGPASSLALVEPAARPAADAAPAAPDPALPASRPSDKPVLALAAPGPAPGPTTGPATGPATGPTPVPVPSPGPAPAEQRPAIDPAQAAAMMRRADALVAIGDFSAARLFYERLALAGDRQAALALARSYDPAWLRQQGVVGVPPDPTRAAQWYARAAAATDDTHADRTLQAKP